jgi:hypothetical protein
MNEKCTILQWQADVLQQIKSIVFAKGVRT